MANVIRKRDEKPTEAAEKNDTLTPEQRAELLKTQAEKEAEGKAEPKVIERHHAKNGAKKVWIEDDVDPTKEKRKRNKHGTAINFPLFVEEFLTIEAVFENALKAGQTESFADYIREVLKAHAKKELGAKKYEEILSKKYNQKILKKDDKIVSE